MTVDVEAGGALATAGLIANAIDHADGRAAPGEHDRPCANCRTALVGAYCHTCGQAAHVHRSIWHMFEEALHGMLHFDSKSWRTLPLLIARPGLLTRRYIEGQRVRYVSPLALFLFTVFLMFFVLSWMSTDITSHVNEGQPGDARAQLVAELERARSEVARHSAALNAARDDDARKEAADELADAQVEERTAAAVLSVFDKAVAASADPSQSAVLANEELRALAEQTFGLGSRTSGVLAELANNPQLMLYKIKNTAYKFSFMLIPISLPFLWLMFFWRRGVTLYDHMVFSMYSLSFMSLLFVLIALMGTTTFTARFSELLLLAPPVHMFLHLREAYRLGFGSALWRTFALLAASGAVFVLFLVLVIAISVA